MKNAVINQLMPLIEVERQYMAGEKPLYFSELEYITINQKDVAYMSYQLPPHAVHPFIQIQKHLRFEEWPIHCHNWLEINYLLKGHCTQIINDKKYTIQEGSLILLDAMTPHKVNKLGEQDILIDIAISQEYLTSAFINRLSTNSLLLDFFTHFLTQKIRSNHFVVFEQGSPKLAELMTIFLSEWLNPGFSHTDMIDSLFSAIISELVNLQSYGIFSDGNEMQPKVFEALKYIEKNYKDCTLNSLAEKLDLTPNYVSNMLKEQTGLTYQQLLQTQRINISKKLLIHTNLPIVTIAEYVGYNNMYFFYTKFKKQIGMTPGDYRNCHSTP